jgi:hypothetical protein
MLVPARGLAGVAKGSWWRMGCWGGCGWLRVTDAPIRQGSHDHEGFTTACSSKVFAIMLLARRKALSTAV